LCTEVTKTTFPEFFVLFTTSAERIYLSMSFPPLTYVPSSAFRALSTVYSSPYLVSLFHPTAVYRIHLSGVFPATQPFVSSTTCALLPLDPFVY
jgi:hypothetical protein